MSYACKLKRLIKSLSLYIIGTALKVKSIDLLKEKNRELHHTSDFEQDDLVIRRGQAFSVALNFDRNPHVEEDIITLLITTGMCPVEMV